MSKIDRYKEWYKNGNITDEQLDKMVEVGLITEAEKQEIIDYAKK